MIPAALLALLLLPPGPGETGPQAPEAPAPYKRAGGVPLQFRGPGREALEPPGDELVLGWFGPGDPDHPSGGDLWRGAVLAMERLNATSGPSVRLMPRWSDSPWQAGAAQVTRMVYDDGVLAILGALDGASAHLAEQVALKARVTLVSSGSTDATVTGASVPWVFSCLPSDAARASSLAALVAVAARGGPFAVAVASEHDARSALGVLGPALTARHLSPRILLGLDPGEHDLRPLAGRLLEGHPKAIVILAPPALAGRLVAELRQRGFDGRLVGGATLARRAFLRAAGGAAEGVVVPLLWEPSPAWEAFARTYEDRWGEPPDHGAAQSYDAVRLVADAARGAGANRVRLREAIRDISPWQGVCGVVRWDSLGQNQRKTRFAVWEGGRLRPIPSQPVCPGPGFVIECAGQERGGAP